MRIKSETDWITDATASNTLNHRKKKKKMMGETNRNKALSPALSNCNLPDG